ncbi:hypothetical protein HDV01_000092 [Terramyces sp. JEL0728]|nr:hypothetical protein HDV01_000092 [Terramyces sp. JEL0728]
MQEIKITETAFELFTKQTLVLFQQKESEENWQKFEAQINKIRQIALGSYQISNFLFIVRTKLHKIIVQCLLTERTRLARSAMNLVSCLAECLGKEFSQLSELLLPTVLKLTTRANKVYVSSATATLKTCVENAGCINLIPHLVEALKNPSKSLRLAAMEVLGLVVYFGGAEMLSGYVNILEGSITSTVLDNATEVRELTRVLFDNYKDKFQDRLPLFVSGMTDQVRKYLKVDVAKSHGLQTRPIRKEDLEEDPKRIFDKPARMQEVEKPVRNNEGGLNKPIRVQNETIEKSVREIFGKPAMHAIGKPVAIKSETASLEKLDDKSAIQESRLPIREASGLPQRIPAAHFDSSGPQRVAREPVEQKSRLRQPQRVVSSDNTLEEKQHQLKSRSNSVKSTVSLTDSIYKPKNTVRKIAQKWATITSPPKDKQINFQQLQFDASNSDWATRLLVYQQLEKYFQSVGSENIDYKSIPIEKSFKIINIGLNDAHFKVVQSCLSCIPAFITSSDLPQAMLDQILPRVFYHAYQPKQKPGIVEKCQVIIDMVRQTIPAQLLGQTIANSLSSPALLPKVRYGCVGYIATLEDFELTNLLSKPYTCRIVVCKLATFLSDNDALTNKTLKLLFNRINLLLPQNFIYSASALTSTERQLLNNVLGREVEYYSSGRSTPGRNTPSPTRSRSRANSVSSTGSSKYSRGSPTPKSISERSPRPVKRSTPSKTIKSTMFRDIDELEIIETPHKNRLSYVTNRPDSANSEATERARSNTPLDEHKVDGIRKTLMGRSITPPPTMDSFGLEVIGKSVSPEVVTGSPDSKTISNEDETTPTEPVITPTKKLIQSSKSVSPASDVHIHNLDDEVAPPGIDDHSMKELDDEREPDGLVPPSVFTESAIVPINIDSVDKPNENDSSTAQFQTEHYITETANIKPDDQVLDQDSLEPPPADSQLPPRRDSVGLTSRRSSVKSSRSVSQTIANPEASFNHALMVVQMENSDSQVIRSNIFQLITHMKQHISDGDKGSSTAILKNVLGLEGRLNEQLYMEVGSAVDSFVAQFESHFPPPTVMHSVIATLSKEVSVKICFDITNRMIPKIPREEFDEFEPLIISQIVKALNSSKSAVRKCAFDVSFTLLQLKGEDWSEEFYKTVRAGAGIPRENVMRSMMATRIARIANNQDAN